MRLLTTFIISVLSLNVFGSEQAISPKLGSHFGKIISIEAFFVEKPNDYYSQNMISELFLISMSSVNGKVY